MVNELTTDCRKIILFSFLCLSTKMVSNILKVPFFSKCFDVYFFKSCA